MTRTLRSFAVAALVAVPGVSAPALAAHSHADVAQQNKAGLRDFYSHVWSQKDYGWFHKHVVPSIMDHNPPPGASGNGEAAIVGTFKMLHTAFPDLQVKVDDLVAEGDRVTARITFTGTNDGPFMGHPATHKKASWTGIDIVRFENGRATDRWGQSDMMALMHQLGMMDHAKHPH